MALSVLQDIRNIFSSLNADEIRAEAHRPVSVGLMAMSEEGHREMERFLVPDGVEGRARTQALGSIHRIEGPPGDFDFVLCETGLPVPANGYTFHPADAHLARQIAADQTGVELAIARNFPQLRRAVSEQIVQRIAGENALFSLVSALPNVVPGLLELPWVVGEFASDTAFLTANQIRMALLLAGAHDRTVGYGEQKAQIAAIAAGAFGWRAIARELAGKIPLGGGLIPKAAIAYAGTYVVGLGLERVNRTGSGLSRREQKEAWKAAFQRGREVARGLLPGRGVRGQNPATGAGQARL